MRVIIRVVCAAIVLAALPSTAFAQSTWISPFIGVNTGGDTTHTSSSVGVSGGRMIWKWLGAEGEVADAPELFGQNGFLISRRVTTVMGNAVIAMPMRDGSMVYPYVSGGLGVLHLHLGEAGELAEVHANKFGWNLGGGASAYFNKNIGIRGDVRYIRASGESDADTNPFGIDFSTFHFWRLSAGLAVRF